MGLRHHPLAPQRRIRTGPASRGGRGLICACGALLTLATADAETLARWRFEPEVEVPAAPEPRAGAGPGREWLVVARGAGLGPGKVGQALWPAGSYGTRAGWISPLPRRVAADAGRLDLVANPMDSRLNLGAHDWTVECWLWLEAGAMDEAVIYEIGSGPPGANELVTRFSVWPRENTFVLTGIGPVGPGEAESVGRRIEFSDPAGPPDGVARWEHVTLAPADLVLPRQQWVCVALGHDAAAGLLRLFLGGRLAAMAPARLMALPRGPAAYVALGCDGRRGRVLRGAMDELRVSDHAVTARDFLPDGTPASPASP